MERRRNDKTQEVPRALGEGLPPAAHRALGSLGRRRISILLTAAGLCLAAAATGGAISQAPAQAPAPAERTANSPAEDSPKDDADRNTTNAVPVRRPGVADIDTSQKRPKIVHIVDENERPIAGAKVSVGWWEDEDGDMLGVVEPTPPVTNEAGEATIHAPLGATRARISTEAEGYVRAGSEYSLSGRPTVKLRPGRIVRVHAVTTDGEPLPEAVPLLEDSRKWPREFEPDPQRPGTFRSPIVSRERRWMRVVDGSGDGPILFSDLIDVTAPESTEEDGTIVAVLRPGVRLEGRLVTSQ
jgi:hypothetical protein